MCSVGTTLSSLHPGQDLIHAEAAHGRTSRRPCAASVQQQRPPHNDVEAQLHLAGQPSSTSKSPSPKWQP